MLSTNQQPTSTTSPQYTEQSDDSDDSREENENHNDHIENHNDQIETHHDQADTNQAKIHVENTATKTSEPRRSLRQFNAQTGANIYSDESSVVHSTYITLVPDHLKRSEKCIAAKLEEIQKLQNFKAYEVVPDDGQQRISTRWVLTMKNEQIKARLVARGFEEMSGVYS